MNMFSNWEPMDPLVDQRELRETKARIIELEEALRLMHKTVHGGVYRSGSPFKDIPGARTIGPHVLGEINEIVRKALGRDDVSLKYFRFPDDPRATGVNHET